MSNQQIKEEHGEPRVQLRVQTPRGLWSMTEPKDGRLVKGPAGFRRRPRGAPLAAPSR